jgi:succinylglutamate desuccinylase
MASDINNSIFVVCQHGGEKTPLKVIEDNFKDKLNYLVANKEAVLKNKRFMDADLNRSFPGSSLGNKEEKLAFELVRELEKYDQVFDLHTTTATSPPFIITTKVDQDHLDLINSFNIEKVVIMQNSIAKGNSLIDYVNLGVSIEAGPQGRQEVYNEYKEFITNFLNEKKTNRKDFYIVFGVIEKQKKEKLNKSIESFKLVKKGQVISKVGDKSRFAEYDFYPVMPGEKSYKNILTIATKKVNLNKLNQIKEL